MNNPIASHKGLLSTDKDSSAMLRGLANPWELPILCGIDYFIYDKYSLLKVYILKL